MKKKSITDFNDLEGEEWRPVEGFPCYQVSNKGRVVSKRGHTTKLLRPATNPNGYHVVSLAEGSKYGEGKQYTKQVHRLVAEAFLGKAPDESYQIDHIDTNPLNNCVHLNPDGTVDLDKTNLRWVTAEENANNPLTKLHRAECLPRIIEKTSHRVYVYDEDLKLVSAFTSTAEAARQTNQSQGNISSCCQGSLRRLNNRIWSYTQLTSIEEREALETTQKEKRDRNLRSVKRAVTKYAENNRDYYNEKAKKWYNEHREHVREYQRQHYRRKKELSQGILQTQQGEDSPENV